MIARLTPHHGLLLASAACGLALLLACDTSPKTSSTRDPTAADDQAAGATEANGEAGAGGTAADPDTNDTDAGAGADDPPREFADAVNAIDLDGPDATDRLVAAFLAHHGKAKLGEQVMHDDVITLLDAVAVQAPALDSALAKNRGLNAAACRFTEQCDSGEPSKEDEARLRQFFSRALTVVYAGEGTVRADVDHAQLGERLASVLTPAAGAFLEALTLGMRADSKHDEGGYGGEPRDLADTVLAWEKVATLGGKVYAADAELRAESALGAYLRVAWRPELPRSPVTKKLRKEYRRFIAEHADSRYAPAVQLFLDTMKKLGNKPTEAELDAAISRARNAIAPAK